jgi:hypothetical protein
MPAALTRFAPQPNNAAGALGPNRLLYVTLTGPASRLFDIAPAAASTAPAGMGARYMALDTLIHLFGLAFAFGSAAMNLSVTK